MQNLTDLVKDWRDRANQNDCEHRNQTPEQTVKSDIYRVCARELEATIAQPTSTTTTVSTYSLNP